MNHHLIILIAAVLTACNTNEEPPYITDFSELIQPASKTSVLEEEDYYVWGGSVVKGNDGLYHMYYSRWKHETYFSGWVTHSEIAHAVAENPEGPFVFRNVALPARGQEYWDGLCTHNPTVKEFEGKYYLYYMGNTGDGIAMQKLNYTHRNNQRIGVAVADSPDGPWSRSDEPLVDISADENAWDALMTSNPSVTQMRDGKYLVLYKAVATHKPLPFGGPVSHLAAIADTPAGPIKKINQRIFHKEGEMFPAEDPYLWYQKSCDRYYAIVKDMQGTFTGAGVSLAFFESDDGLNWQPAANPLASKLEVQWQDGTTDSLAKLERAQILFEDGEPAMLYCASGWPGEFPAKSFNIHIPLKMKGEYFVRGGQFKDFILPMPIIDGLESEGIWGNEHVVPRDKDNGIEDSIWCYWGGNPILGKDGNYHIAICRWKENTGHHGWFESEVAHCMADNPFGPYTITEPIVEKGHNPEVMRMQDGSFVLHVMDNRVFVADHMTGPWKLMGTMALDSRGFKPSNRFGSNLTSEFRPDGSIIVMKKDGDITLSEKDILGPYKMMSINNYTRSTGYPEDPVIWRSRHQYHSIYNHAQDRKSGYMRSIDGIHWKNEEGLPYDASTTFYTDGSKNTWYKFERPKVIQDQFGRATHLSLAVMDVAKRDEKANDNHSSKNMIMPLLVEKNISILNEQPITSSTKKIRVKIEAGEGFNPQSDLDITSLRFGSDQLVNYGGGCEAVKTEKSGKDLVVTFQGAHGINHRDYDFKLLGQTTLGDLVYGYALLPGRSVEEASLIALPLQVEEDNGIQVLKGAVENCGLSASSSCIAEVREYNASGMRILGSIKVDSIQPYQSRAISVSLDGSDVELCNYEVVIRGDHHYDEYWQKEDETSEHVRFTGNWKVLENEAAFLKKEMATETLGDAVEFSFSGTRVKVFGQLGRQFGSYKVYIDGEYIETIRCNYAPVNHSPIYQSGVLENGNHTLRLVKTETEYNGPVSIDAFAVEKETN